MKIRDFEFKAHRCGGRQAIVWFRNGYDASVVAGPIFYNTTRAPYEIVVLGKDDIVYDTPITSDVYVYLTEIEAIDILAQIESLERMK